MGSLWSWSWRKANFLTLPNTDQVVETLCFRWFIVHQVVKSSDAFAVICETWWARWGKTISLIHICPFDLVKTLWFKCKKSFEMFVLLCYLKAGFSIHLLILLYFRFDKKRSTLKKDYKINQTYYLYLNIPFNKQWYIISDVMVYNRGKMLFFCPDFCDWHVFHKHYI